MSCLAGPPKAQPSNLLTITMVAFPEVGFREHSNECEETFIQTDFCGQTNLEISKLNKSKQFFLLMAGLPGAFNILCLS